MSEAYEHQAHTAPIAASWAGLFPAPAMRIENACASSGSALRCGIMAIMSGLYDIVLVGGVEKMTNQPTPEVTGILATASDYPVTSGVGWVVIFSTPPTRSEEHTSELQSRPHL